jgi:hypothetical protein
MHGNGFKSRSSGLWLRLVLWQDTDVSEDLAASILWVVTPLSVVAGYRRFGGSCFTTQKTTIWVFNAVKTSNFASRIIVGTGLFYALWTAEITYRRMRWKYDHESIKISKKTIDHGLFEEITPAVALGKWEIAWETWVKVVDSLVEIRVGNLLNAYLEFYRYAKTQYLRDHQNVPTRWSLSMSCPLEVTNKISTIMTFKGWNETLLRTHVAHESDFVHPLI